MWAIPYQFKVLHITPSELDERVAQVVLCVPKEFHPIAYIASQMWFIKYSTSFVIFAVPVTIQKS